MSFQEKNDMLVRDRMDYEIDSAYVWRKPTFPNRSRKYSMKKRVSFFDLENEDTADHRLG